MRLPGGTLRSTRKIIKIILRKMARFYASKTAIECTTFLRITPQLHHKKPPLLTTFLQNPPSKTPAEHGFSPGVPTPENFYHNRIFSYKLSENQAGFFEKLRIPSTWKSFNPAFSTYTSRLFPFGSVGLRKKPVSSTKSLVLLMIPSIISPS